MNDLGGQMYKVINYLRKCLIIGACLSGVGFASTIEHYNLPENQQKNLPFSEAVRVKNTVYLSGQIGITPGQGQLVKGGFKAEAEQVMTNIGLVLKHFSLTHNDISKCMVFLKHLSDFPEFNQVYKSFFTPPYPARSTLVAADLALGALVEVECIAHIQSKEVL